jgi:hypothetical protein
MVSNVVLLPCLLVWHKRCILQRDWFRSCTLLSKEGGCSFRRAQNHPHGLEIAHFKKRKLLLKGYFPYDQLA